MGKNAGSMGVGLLKKMRLEVIGRISAELETRGWAIADLARACNVKAGAIYKKLNTGPDFHKITIEDIEMFANALEIEPADLIPKKFVDEVHEAFNTLPFIDLMRIICRKEIEKYFANQK